MTAEDFIKQFLPVARVVESETGIPALAMLTQSALETGWGTRVKANNYFGIKGRDVMVRTREVMPNPNVKFPEIISVKAVTINGKQMWEYDVKTWFAGYPTPIAAFRKYAQFIKDNRRYAAALKQTTPAAYLTEIARAGYATAPNYAKTLLDVLKSVEKRLPNEELCKVDSNSH